MITLDKLYDLYIDTIKKCSSSEMEKSDEVISYNVFEEFDIGYTSFLHEDSLNKLLENNFISCYTYDLTIKLINEIVIIKNSGLWNMNAIKDNNHWKKVVELCDEILDNIPKN